MALTSFVDTLIKCMPQFFKLCFSLKILIQYITFSTSTVIQLYLLCTLLIILSRLTQCSNIHQTFVLGNKFLFRCTNLAQISILEFNAFIAIPSSLGLASRALNPKQEQQSAAKKKKLPPFQMSGVTFHCFPLRPCTIVLRRQSTNFVINFEGKNLWRNFRKILERLWHRGKWSWNL